MKGLSRIVFGSITGSLLGAGVFFAMDAFQPDHADAATICRKGYSGGRVCTTDTGTTFKTRKDYAVRDVTTGKNGNRQTCRTNYAGHYVCG